MEALRNSLTGKGNCLSILSEDFAAVAASFKMSASKVQNIFVQPLDMVGRIELTHLTQDEVDSINWSIIDADEAFIYASNVLYFLCKEEDAFSFDEAFKVLQKIYGMFAHSKCGYLVEVARHIKSATRKSSEFKPYFKMVRTTAKKAGLL